MSRPPDDKTIRRWLRRFKVDPHPWNGEVSAGLAREVLRLRARLRPAPPASEHGGGDKEGGK